MWVRFKKIYYIFTLFNKTALDFFASLFFLAERMCFPFRFKLQKVLFRIIVFILSKKAPFSSTLNSFKNVFEFKQFSSNYMQCKCNSRSFTPIYFCFDSLSKKSAISRSWNFSNCFKRKCHLRKNRAMCEAVRLLVHCSDETNIRT